MVDALRGEGLNPLNMMVDSGARGNMMQLRQIAGMRGVVANPRGDMISRPIKSNFREGLSVLEYFISTPGARKGLVDTALRTADSGYLTRRLVDVAQELIINDEDPFENNEPVPGIQIDLRAGDRPLEVRLLGRVLADDVTLDDGTVVAAGEMVTRRFMERLAADSGLDRVRVLSPLTDNSLQGISAKSYGMSLATGALIETGEAVGVIAAQSIGEPGTQLTMRTFHTGGAMELGRSVSDIARGLPVSWSCSRPAPPRARRPWRGARGTLRVDEPDGQQQRLRVVALTAPRRSTSPSWGRAWSSPTATRWRPATCSSRATWTRRSYWRSRVCAPCSSTSPDEVAGRLPRAGRVDPRQAHRADRAPDDPARARPGIR